jgi:NAD(P)-dependent dehydrogenase (short-subunit alcohol dehydrogenase family)
MGATVVITARNEKRLEETLDKLTGDNHVSFVADLVDNGSTENLIANLPLLDGCVLNAGFSKILPIQFFSEEELEKSFHINSFSPMLLTRWLLKSKKMKKKSSIVFISSISGHSNTSPGYAVYGSSKAALNAFVKYAALELAGKKIRCNAIYPGRINTSFIQNSAISEVDLQKDIEQYPLKRYGEPREVAHAIIYLLSDASSWITGSGIVIDGGRSLK